VDPIAMMKMILRDQEWEVPHGMTLRDAMLKVGLDPESILTMRGGKLVSEETLGQDGDVIQLVSVISGG
jgi:sulfur carrier protein ThiS